MEYFTGLLNNVVLLFYGRVMYQLMFPYWANIARDRSGFGAEIRFAEKLVSIDKVVVSRSMVNVDRNTTIIRNDPVDDLWKN